MFLSKVTAGKVGPKKKSESAVVYVFRSWFKRFFLFIYFGLSHLIVTSSVVSVLARF